MLFGYLTWYSSIFASVCLMFCLPPASWQFRARHVVPHLGIPAPQRMTSTFARLRMRWSCPDADNPDNGFIVGPVLRTMAASLFWRKRHRPDLLSCASFVNGAGMANLIRLSPRQMSLTQNRSRCLLAGCAKLNHDLMCIGKKWKLDNKIYNVSHWVTYARNTFTWSLLSPEKKDPYV